VIAGERIFRKLVGQPADHYVDLFWARLMPYIAVAAPGRDVGYTLLVRNTFDHKVEYSARLHPPPGWSAAAECSRLRLPPGGQGEIALAAKAPTQADGIRV
jgi:hypothetical protein